MFHRVSDQPHEMKLYNIEAFYQWFFNQIEHWFFKFSVNEWFEEPECAFIHKVTKFKLQKNFPITEKPKEFYKRFFPNLPTYFIVLHSFYLILKKQRLWDINGPSSHKNKMKNGITHERLWFNLPEENISCGSFS